MHSPSRILIHSLATEPAGWSGTEALVIVPTSRPWRQLDEVGLDLFSKGQLAADGTSACHLLSGNSSYFLVHSVLRQLCPSSDSLKVWQLRRA